MSEGILRVRREYGGWRHYIGLPNGDQDDLHCGSALEVCVGRWEEETGGERLVPDHWLAGRYEANLRGENRDDVEAYLYLGSCYPVCDELACGIPLGIKVRRPGRSQ
jgi:hypothetical protein